ncbi:MAG: TRIC cation channel family protein [Lachnospiraceae bacterium]|nr:TRIC cation channel family protein [Lachnospiraceae bacterium]
MQSTDIIIFIMEITGTIAFASSGTMLAIQQEMDLFGVCVLGVTTAVGGGLVRDLILGIIPPGMFRSPVYTLVAVGVSILLFIAIYVNQNGNAGILGKIVIPRKMKAGGHIPGSRGASFPPEKVAQAYDRIMLIFDAVGLGIFTVVGINTAVSAGYRQRFLLIFVGVITGVGGGLLRDVMAQVKPYILTRHVYACASLAGAFVCVLGYPYLGRLGAMLSGAAVVMLIRFLAAHYRWNLPRIRKS